MAQTCGMGWGWLPLAVVVLMSGSMFVTYTIAVLNGNVAALFPYISDAGSSHPEDAIFAQFLNIAAAIATFTLILRYQIVMDLVGETSIRINCLAKAAVVFGVMAAFGLTLVGNFQADKIPSVHFTGAFLVFVLGEVYVVLDTIIAFHMVPRYHSPCKAYLRLSIAVLGAFAIVVTLIGDQVSSYQAEQAGVIIHRKHWEPTDPGYSVHLVSAFGEWIMCGAFIVYYAALIGDFRRLRLGLTLRYLPPVPDPTLPDNTPHKMEVGVMSNGVHGGVREQGMGERDFLNVDTTHAHAHSQSSTLHKMEEAVSNGIIANGGGGLGMSEREHLNASTNSTSEL